MALHVAKLQAAPKARRAPKPAARSVFFTAEPVDGTLAELARQQRREANMLLFGRDDD